MATAGLRAIRHRFPEARVVHLLRRYVAELLAGTDLCDDQVFWPEKRNRFGGPGHAERGRGGTLDLIHFLRRERFDLAVLLTNSFRSALVVRLAGVARRVGYARDGRSWLLTDQLKPLRKNGAFVPVPALDYYNDVARHLGCEDVGDRLFLSTTEDDEAAIDRRLGTPASDRALVVLNPGANYGSAKCWPAEKYAALADELVERYGARVVASLGPKECEIADRLRRAARRPLEVFNDPPLGLGPLRALIRRCDLLITNDTGPRHFAAAFDVPVITLFGSSDPAWTETRHPKERIVKLDLDCQPCMERVCPLKHHDCMTRLDPEMVLRAADEFLKPKQASPGAADARMNVAGQS